MSAPRSNPDVPAAGGAQEDAAGLRRSAAPGHVVGSGGTRVAVVGRFPPPYHGQAISTAVLAGLLAEVGYEVESVNETYRDASDARVQAGTGLLERVRTVAAVVRFCAVLRGRLRRMAPDVVVYGSLSATVSGHVRNLATYLLSFPRGVPVLAVTHNGDLGDLAHRTLTRRSWRWLLGRTERLVALSDRLADRLETAGRTRLAVVPNTLDPVLDAGVAAPVRGEPQRLLDVVFLGNLIPEKGVFEAIDAVRTLGLRGVAVRLRIVGDAPSEAARRAVTDRCGTEGAAEVEYVGVVHDRAGLASLLSSSHALLLPTRYRHEALPMVIIEAMACGTPVVSTHQGGIPDLVDHGRNGFLVPGEGCPDLPRALDRLRVPGVWPALSVEARAHYERNLSRRAVGRRWSELLDEAAATGRRRP